MQFNHHTSILNNPRTAKNRVYIGNLTNSVTEKILLTKFGVHGKIFGYSRKGPSYCFIEFESAICAINAINHENGIKLGSRKLIVKNCGSDNGRVGMKRKSNDLDDIGLNKKYFTSSNAYTGENDILIAEAIKSDEVTRCEIIVESARFTKYAKTIGRQLKMLGFNVDLLYPIRGVPLNEIMSNLCLRHVYYAITISQKNLIENSMTILVLHGNPTEHRNIPTMDGIKFMYKDYDQKLKGIIENGQQHPKSIISLVKSLTMNYSLTTFQYDTVLKYLTEQRERQKLVELGNTDEGKPHSSIERDTIRAKLLSDESIQQILRNLLS